MIGLSGLELRGHVASAMNGSECKASYVGFGVSSNLVVNFIHLPFLVNVPVHVGDPVLCTNGRNRTIDISRVVEHVVVLTFKCLVNPLRPFRLNDGVDVLGAEAPRLDVGRNMERVSDIFLVKVLNERRAPCARRKLISTTFLLSLKPGSVISGTPRVRSVKLLRAVCSIQLRVRSKTVADSKDVVDIHLGNVPVELIEIGGAFSSSVLAVRSGEITLGSVNLFLKLCVIE